MINRIWSDGNYGNNIEYVCVCVYIFLTIFVIRNFDHLFILHVYVYEYCLNFLPRPENCIRSRRRPRVPFECSTGVCYRKPSNDKTSAINDVVASGYTCSMAFVFHACI